MNILKNKAYANYNYTSRYSDVPYYFNIIDQREIYGIGTNMLKNTVYVSHKITRTDTLDYLALKYYGNPTYWWVIAYYNDIQDAFVHLSDAYNILKIPNLSSIEFGENR